MPIVDHLTAIEILDSRGRPTIQATCVLSNGTRGTASVPAGMSIGPAEALELRDGDARRYRGLGCRKAVANIEGELSRVLSGREFNQQNEFDQMIIVMDGTPNKARFGANAILATSLAFAKACAAAQNIPLYQYFAGMLEQSPKNLPRPMINLFSHSQGATVAKIPVQAVQIMPLTAQTIDEVMAIAFEIYYTAADLTAEKQGSQPLTAAEGGLAPAFPNVEAMLDTAVEAIQKAGFKPGEEVALAVDVAAGQFYREGHYHLANGALDGVKMVAQLMAWLDAYPIVSLEDGLAEDDWDNWSLFCKQATKQTIVLGGDLVCTNPIRIRRAIEARAANALLLKVNQIGTLTEACEASRSAKTADWRVVASARSGETEDDWLADLAVGWGSDYIKAGSISQSERLVKYNRLLAIEATTTLTMANYSNQ